VSVGADRPHFLGIGAQKAASSWLADQLKLHPGVWMPHRKELHYFDRDPKYPSPNHLSEPSRWRRLMRLDRERFVRDFGAALLRGDLERWRWSWRYHFGTPDNAWYRDLFHEAGERVTGEITPAYIILDHDDVRAVHELLPEAHVLLILRNPIDRAWSQVRWTWTRGRLDSLDDTTRIIELIDSPDQELRSDYRRMIRQWGSCYGDERFHVLFYEQIQHEPDRVMQRVCGWLGLDPDRLPPTGGAANVSRSRRIPEAVELHLAKKYLADLESLADMFGQPCTGWYEDAGRVIEASMTTAAAK